MKKSKRKRITGFVVAVIVLIVLAGLIGGYVWHNIHYFDRPLRQTEQAGFIEKQVSPDGQNTLNYAEGPDNGPPLLLLHGQLTAWQDYAEVLRPLSKYYHIYLIDCYGHGASDKNPDKYSASAIGKDYIWFIENIIREPAVVSGHSLGGLIATWLAGHSPENVRGVVLEDPPLFSSEADRCEMTFAWIDSHEPIHRYVTSENSGDYALFYLKNSMWIKYFGEGSAGVIKTAEAFRAKHPNRPLNICYLPPSINQMFRYMDEYDPSFGDTFYDCSWFAEFDHAETLARITCPAVLIHANFSIDSNGILLGAMSDEDAARANALMKDSRIIEIDSGHDVHLEKPDAFIQVMIEFLEEIE